MTLGGLEYLQQIVMDCIYINDYDDDDVSTILVPGGRLVMKLDINSSKV